MILTFADIETRIERVKDEIAGYAERINTSTIERQGRENALLTELKRVAECELACLERQLSRRLEAMKQSCSHCLGDYGDGGRPHRGMLLCAGCLEEIRKL